MKRVLYYAMITIMAGGSPAARPAWAQEGGGDRGGRQQSRKSDGKPVQEYPHRIHLHKQMSLLQELGAQLSWEIKLSPEQYDQIRKILREFESGDNERRDDILSKLNKAIRKTDRDGNRACVRELKQLQRELQREPKESSEMLPSEVVDAIAELLSEEQQSGFWEVVHWLPEQKGGHPEARSPERKGGHLEARNPEKQGGDPGPWYLDLLRGLSERVSDEQREAILSRHQNYVDELENTDKGDRQALQEVHRRFREEVMAVLNEAQRAAFQEALKKHRQEGRQASPAGRDGRESGRGAGGKGAKRRPSNR